MRRSDVLTPEMFKEAMGRITLKTGLKTQNQLAEALGIRQSSISDAKRRSWIPASWLMKLLEVYNLNPTWILTGTGYHFLKDDPDRQGAAEIKAAHERNPKTISELRALLQNALGDDLSVVIIDNLKK